MKKWKFSLSDLFYNNKFVLAFSVFASVVLWIAMVSTNTEEVPHAVTDVPIVINLSDAAQQDGLRVFSPVDAKATVFIRGNSLVVNQIRSTDLQVVAQSASTLTSPGSYSLTLTPQKKGNLTDYEVVSISPNQVVIDVDRYKEKNFPIDTTGIKFKSDYVSDTHYFVGTPVPDNDTVTVSGPETDVLRINKVAVQHEITETLRESQNFTEKLILYDANGNKIENDRLTLSTDHVNITIPVLARKILPLKMNFLNKPPGFNFTEGQVAIDPQTIEVAGPEDVISSMQEVSLAPLDFSDISPSKNTFDLNVTLPSTCKNLSGIPTVKVTLNLGALSTRTMVVNHFSVKNLAADKTASVNTKSLTVVVVGPESEISKLTPNSLSAQVDMAGQENFTGHTEMPASISISNARSSWVYGSYMVNFSVSSKS